MYVCMYVWMYKDNKTREILLLRIKIPVIFILHLQIPPTQGQYSSTKSYHCPSPGEHNLKGLPSCNVILRIFFIKLNNTYSKQK